ncbi:hypothetical protein BJY04DRAFT_212157 [Aspergillus karnatakaensis]|uniref:uncharacterized protein n=1 Tax=Aspergillus karnatakaensis TaxID=1810916 RepID=UPI003CCCDD5A
MVPPGKSNSKSPQFSKPAVLSWRIGAAPAKTSKVRRLLSILVAARPDDAPTHQALVLQRPAPEIYEIATSLDPFCEVPFALTSEDRSLLHSYLLHVPSQVYGARPDSEFSAVRDVSFPISLGSSLTMWWMLIAANGLFTNTSGGLVRTSVARRKQRAYKLLNDAISQNHGRVTDEVLGGIIMAAITEARLSDPVAANAHLRGYEAALAARGGLRASLASCSLPALQMAHLMPYLVTEPAPTDPRRTEEEQMQQLIHFLVSEIRHRGFSPSPFPVDVSPGSGLLLLQHTLAGLEFGSRLTHYLHRDIAAIPRFVDEASRFLSLFLLLLTLWRVSESVEKTHLFISRIEALLADSAEVDIETGLPLLTEQGFMWVVIKAVKDLQVQCYGMEEDGGLWPILHAVGALRVYRGMGRAVRGGARLLLLHVLSGRVLRCL